MGAKDKVIFFQFKTKKSISEPVLKWKKSPIWKMVYLAIYNFGTPETNNKLLKCLLTHHQYTNSAQWRLFYSFIFQTTNV